MTKTYKIIFNKAYLKELESIPKKVRNQILESVNSLSNNPRPEGVKKLKGFNDPLYRIRCGDYRIVYTIRDKELIVLVIQVGHRKDIYK